MQLISKVAGLQIRRTLTKRNRQELHKIQQSSTSAKSCNVDWAMTRNNLGWVPAAQGAALQKRPWGLWWASYTWDSSMSLLQRFVTCWVMLSRALRRLKNVVIPLDSTGFHFLAHTGNTGSSFGLPSSSETLKNYRGPRRGTLRWSESWRTRHIKKSSKNWVCLA